MWPSQKSGDEVEYEVACYSVDHTKGSRERLHLPSQKRGEEVDDDMGCPSVGQ